ncbi:MAG: HNH endonuclease [Phycisphaerales bacterium]|jgi:5-methylcytosine-specific restriction endonuclease McrA|nr:HNH endonuclease [Phycisphaerales bacterium]
MTCVPSIEERVLVLNRGYAAIRIVPARDAFTLLCRKAAEIISIEDGHYLNYELNDWMDVASLQKELEPNEHRWLRLPSFEIAVPKIIRLLMYDKFVKPEVRLTRRNLYARDKNRCQYCGKRFSASDLTLDHVVPRVQGGGNSWANLVCACLKCNTRKGGRTPKQAHMTLIHKPFRPAKCEAQRLRVGRAQYQSWKQFLNNAYWSVELNED